MTSQTTPQTSKIKTPVLISIIAILTVIIGIFTMFAGVPAILLGTLTAIITLIIGIGLTASAYGISNMKRWGLYLYSAIGAIAVLQSVYNYASSINLDALKLADMIIPILVLTYLWSQSKKFI